MPRVALIREQLEDREVQNYTALPDLGIEVAVVTRHASGPYSATGLGLPVRRLRNSGDLVPRQLRRPLVTRQIRRVVEPESLRGFADAVADCDILCVNELHTASAVQAVELKKTRPQLRVVNVVYENIPFRYDDSDVLRSRRSVARSGTDLFVALTPTARDALLLEGTPPERIVTFPYGVTTSNYPARSGRGGQSDEVTFLFAGRLLQEKGLIPLLVALHNTSHRARLRIMGQGPELGRIRQAIDTLQLQDRVTLSGCDGARMNLLSSAH